MLPGTAMVVWNGQEWIVQGTSTATANMTGAIMALENKNSNLTVQQAAASLILVHPAPK
jgi:hypothetical protein